MKDCPGCNCENHYCTEKTEDFIKALKSVALYCGYSPEHLGANDYSDPGIKLAQEIMRAMATEARIVLGYWDVKF